MRSECTLLNFPPSSLFSQNPTIVNVPKPPELVARFMVIMSSPQRRGKVGLHILQALHAIGPVLNPAIAGMWDNAIPRLASYLQSILISPPPPYKQRA